MINDAEVDLDPDALRSAERLLEELHTLDPHPGTAFRYFDPDRIPDSWYSVSIDNLSGVMRRWRNLFEEIRERLPSLRGFPRIDYASSCFFSFNLPHNITQRLDLTWDKV